jgi:T5SS/PEP-CTERM-associated repeat protein
VNGSGPNGSTAIGVFQNGGLLTVNGGQFLDQSFVTVGFSPGITGTANLSGGGFASDTTLTLGHLAGSTGNVTISGGSRWGNSFVTVGESGTGNLTITSGGELASGGGVIAANPGSSGTVLVTGTGSEFFSRGLVVQSGGSVTATSGGTINSGGTTLSNFGNVTVGSGGSLVTGNSIIGFGPYLQFAGSTTVAGTLHSNNYILVAGSTTVQNGGQLTADGTYEQAGNTIVNPGGTLSASLITMLGGSLQVDGTVNPLMVNINSGAMLFGTGNIIGDVTNAGSIFPGDMPLPGLLSETGNYTQTDTGAFIENIGGSSSFGDLGITGTATLNGALDITLLDGFIPFNGEIFTIATFNDLGLPGTFSTVDLFNDPSQNVSVLYSDNELQIQFNNRAPVPEPTSIILLGSGLGGLIWRFRNKTSGSQLGAREPTVVAPSAPTGSSCGLDVLDRKHQ